MSSPNWQIQMYYGSETVVYTASEWHHISSAGRRQLVDAAAYKGTLRLFMKWYYGRHLEHITSYQKPDFAINAHLLEEQSCQISPEQEKQQDNWRYGFLTVCKLKQCTDVYRYLWHNKYIIKCHHYIAPLRFKARPSYILIHNANHIIHMSILTLSVLRHSQNSFNV